MSEPETVYVKWAIPNCTVNWSELTDETSKNVHTLTMVVRTVICALVDQPDEVRINVHANHRRMMFTIHCVDEDVKFAIGGRRACTRCGLETSAAHANALRTILIAACKKLGYHMEMDIIGPSGEPDWSS